MNIAEQTLNLRKRRNNLRMAKAPRKLLYGISWILIFAVYFSSELILRVYYLHGNGNSKEQMESWANKLPGFLTDSLKAQQRTEKAEKDLKEVLKGSDKKKIIEAYYALAYELEGEDQIKVFTKLHEAYPNDLKTKAAFIFIFNEDDEKYNYDYLVSYAEKFKKHEQARVYTDAWSKIQSFSLPTQERYLKKILEKKYINADLFYIYEAFESLSFKLKLSIEIEDQIEALKSRCLLELKKRNIQEKKKGKGKGK
ncbi:MAG: hypothetical protein NE334_11945 [Lentisphaeraceae bacterium]|nr:hypothetical protein [Lentisphaeraceae bacterium]